MQDNDFTKILGGPGYRVFQHEINRGAKTLRLWVRRMRRSRALICSGCGKRVRDLVDASEREVRDLPWGEYRTAVVVEGFRVRCPVCGGKIERVPQLSKKAPFRKLFEDAVRLACESSAARQVGRQLGLAASTVRAIDLRYLTRWAAQRRRPALKQMGVDEIWLGKRTKFLTVVSNLESGEPVWFGRDRLQTTLDTFFREELSRGQRSRIHAACVDMWQAFTNSLRVWAPRCRIIYDKFHVIQHANAAVDDVRRAEFFRKGGHVRQIVNGKRWLLLSRWVHLDAGKRQQLNALFALNRRVFKRSEE